MLLLASAVVRLPGERGGRSAGTVVTMLERTDLTLEERLQRLIALGPNHVDQMIELLLKGDLEETQRDLLSSALTHVPDRLSLARFAIQCERPRGLEERLSGARVLAAIGGGGALRELFRLYQPFEARDLEVPGVVDTFESVLTRLLRGGDAHQELIAALPSIDHAFLPSIVRAVGASGREEVLPVLHELLVRDASLSVPLFDSMDTPDVRSLARFGGDPRSALVKSFLPEANPEIRAAAVRALGRLRDESCYLDLVNVMATDKPSISDAARTSLMRITGRDFGSDAREWEGHYFDELAWLGRVAPDASLGLDAIESAPALSALKAFSGHRLFHRQAARMLSGGLWHTDWRVGVGTVQRLEELESPAALPALIEALDHRSPEVAQAAWSALSRLTGETLTADRDVWLSWLEN